MHVQQAPQAKYTPGWKLAGLVRLSRALTEASIHKLNSGMQMCLLLMICGCRLRLTTGHCFSISLSVAGCWPADEIDRNT